MSRKVKTITNPLKNRLGSRAGAVLKKVGSRAGTRENPSES